jgi:hypothetical protein
MTGKEQHEGYTVEVSVDTMGDGLFDYLDRLPPRLQPYELARLAFIGFRSLNAKGGRSSGRKGMKEELLMPVVNLIGGAIKWS